MWLQVPAALLLLPKVTHLRHLQPLLRPLLWLVVLLKLRLCPPTQHQWVL